MSNEHYTPKSKLFAQPRYLHFGIKIDSILLGYLRDHIKPNPIQFEWFHKIMKCHRKGTFYLTIGVTLYLVIWNE